MLHALIRLPLRLIPHSAVVQVLSGINRGMRWRVGSSVHGCWIGHYEREKQRIVRELVKPGMLALDIGANAGFYSLAFARLGARVIAFEPAAENAEALRFHVAANNLPVEVHQVAVSDCIGTARFNLGPHLSMGKIDPAGETVIATTTLDALGLKPDVVKIDVEGGELAALRGARDLLAERRTTWLVALDDPAKRAECLALLSGYRIHEFAPGEIAAFPI
jgi:FkbM family methyltransferase